MIPSFVFHFVNPDSQPASHNPPSSSSSPHPFTTTSAPPHFPPLSYLNHHLNLHHTQPPKLPHHNPTTTTTMLAPLLLLLAAGLTTAQSASQCGTGLNIACTDGSCCPVGATCWTFSAGPGTTSLFGCCPSGQSPLKTSPIPR